MLKRRRIKKRGSILFVCGPPGSGKTTYCKQNAIGKDIIWDLDEIAACLNPYYSKNKNRDIGLNNLLGSWRDSLIAAIRKLQITNNAYVIITDTHHARILAKQTLNSSVKELRKREV